MKRFVARSVVVLCLAWMAGCTSPAPPSSPSTSAPDADPGPPPAIPTTEGATLTLSGAGVSPTQVRVYRGSHVTFINGDVVNHEILSNPLHVHTDCPELNVVGFLTPGQSRDSGAFEITRSCGFHDHLNEGDVRFYGTVFVDPR
jgi:hypothetical protein